MVKPLTIILIILGLGSSWYWYSKNQQAPVQPVPTEKPQAPKTQEVEVPLTNAKSRVTKKPFGIFVTPQNSPVSPERFYGFHTGADFEILEGEAGVAVPVRAICEGEVFNRQMVSGYGGVILQSCELGGQKVVVLYGHIDLDTDTPKAYLKKGDFIANLAANNSNMRGGERKHLHLGILKGSVVNNRGYVQNRAELSGWLNPLDFIQQR